MEKVEICFLPHQPLLTHIVSGISNQEPIEDALTDLFSTTNSPKVTEIRLTLVLTEA